MDVLTHSFCTQHHSSQVGSDIIQDINRSHPSNRPAHPHIQLHTNTKRKQSQCRSGNSIGIIIIRILELTYCALFSLLVPSKATEQVRGIPKNYRHHQISLINLKP